VVADGVSVSAHESGGVSWTMVRAVPHPGLSRVVAGPYCGYRERTAQPFRRREVASGQVAMIISFGEPIDVVEMSNSTSGGHRLTSFVAGLHEGYAVTEHGGDQHGVQVDLTPLGAARLLGAAPYEVANECVALDDLLGRFAGELTDRLASAPDWRSRFALLDETLLRRASEGPEPDGAVAWAWDQLARSHGQVPVRVLAEEIGWSRRYFASRFRSQVGLTPKPTGRVLRFRRAVDVLRAGPMRSLADLAACCGYADHSHLVREFRSLGGCTPSQLAGAQLPDGGGVSA
jgi:AraC-like DNA-binding protein